MGNGKSVATLTVDDEAPFDVALESKYRVGSPDKPTFNFWLPPDDLLSFIGVLGVTPGSHGPAVDDSYYASHSPKAYTRFTLWARSTTRTETCFSVRTSLTS